MRSLIAPKRGLHLDRLEKQLKRKGTTIQAELLKLKQTASSKKTYRTSKGLTEKDYY